MNKSELRKFLGVLAFGLLLLSVGLGMFFGSGYNNPDRMEGVATITEIKEIKEEDISKEIYALVEFEVEGIHYAGKLNYYISTMKAGDSVNIFYSKANPYEFGYRSTTNWVPILFMALGGFFMLISFPNCKFSSWIYKLRMRKFDKYRKYGYVEEEQE